LSKTFYKVLNCHRKIKICCSHNIQTKGEINLQPLPDVQYFGDKTSITKEWPPITSVKSFITLAQGNVDVERVLPLKLQLSKKYCWIFTNLFYDKIILYVFM
jgi:hypothetical protein